MGRIPLSGVDIDRDIIKKIAFDPKISEEPKEMNKRMGLKEELEEYFKAED